MVEKKIHYIYAPHHFYPFLGRGMGQQGLITGTGAPIWEGPLWCKPSWSFPLMFSHRGSRSKGWVISDQTTTREGVQPHPSTDKWTKILLSKALFTRARPRFFHHHSLPSGSLYKSLSLLHHKADRRSKKKHSLTVA